ncbi:MAG: iron-only hydrogenase system regulator [Actinomycetaceae bacterium]|nr:iron-only hydrogenase system regulator [Actinomycetaceae bacterium]
METRVAVISIVVTDADRVDVLNELLHEYSQHIIGRMGIPYQEKGINIISVAVDAPVDEITSLSSALDSLDGINAKVIYA